MLVTKDKLVVRLYSFVPYLQEMSLRDRKPFRSLQLEGRGNLLSRQYHRVKLLTPTRSQPIELVQRINLVAKLYITSAMSPSNSKIDIFPFNIIIQLVENALKVLKYKDIINK